MKFYDYKTLYFTVETNTTASTDIDPAISIDYVNRVVADIYTLTRALGSRWIQCYHKGDDQQGRKRGKASADDS